jgi:hypothetical protein
MEDIYHNPPIDRHSIKYCWEQFRKNKFRLKIDIEPLYQMIGIKYRSEDSLRLNHFPVLKLTQHNHLCINEPNEDKLICETNPFYKYSFTSVDVSHIDNL